jgi:hypothetical protein
MLRCAVLVGAIGLLTQISGAVASAAAPIKTGTYVGTTSQKQPFKFKIQKTSCYTAAGSKGGGQGHPKAGYCYVPVTYGSLQTNYPALNETCADGSTVTVPGYSSGFELLLSGGHLTYMRQGFDTGDPDPTASTSTFTLKVTRSKATGTITQTDPSAAGSCASGTVTFIAHRA